ncbi:MAG: TonB-dependent receptor [Alphaproteobacteria bacterium]|jgi:outer membrane receptor protein involved in Fe transport|nr:TonB-dependent receptor [Alphaproteobacteria bacterium]MBU2041464.1 TonB-dependent receptor [Alphaproteobacteria bacterium]MBU2124550.1 TonB-dependent receptor [Alphaproteobacteria bacterium]MBU2208292.1 TonB-dependent receptor [Alphaproteobacteria bacterium]MBU2289777.1 TonB-dependent receptor [Alphaproteobacteria bacterium]
MSLKIMLLVGVSLATVSGAAMAQTPTPAATPQTPPAQEPGAQPPAAEEEAGALDDVVVTARPNDVRTSIDSISYSLADDLQAQTGTLAEALRNVPSVEVDPDGNVSLRGDSNVTILVDGRPSTQFNGPSRGQLVQQIPASQYARIEVMTNPSAAYSPEGSGGVINLISKPNVVRQGATTTGSLRANIGDGGRWNFGGNIAHVIGKTTLTADIGLRHDAFLQEIERVRTRFDAGSGQFLEARQTQDIEGDSDNVFVRLAAEHNIDDRTQLTGDVRHVDVDSFADAVDLYQADAAGGGLAVDYTRNSGGGFSGTFSGGSTRLLRRFDDQGHEWSNEVRFDRNRFVFGFDTEVDQRIPAAPLTYETIENRNRQNQLGVTSAYVRPMADGGRLRAGYELQASNLELDNFVARGPAPTSLTPDPIVSNEFHVDQQVHALYATFERPFGENLSGQFGLRLEQANIDLDQVTTNIQRSNDYFRAYPTMHLQYALGEGESLRGSFSRRIQRPGPQDLNPFLTYQDNLNYRSGNPDLLPQETDSFELTWQKRVAPAFYQATLYYRDTTDAFTPVTTDIGGGVFLTRPENLGSSTAMGVELVANGQLHSTLRYNASINAFRQEIDAAGLAGASDSAGESVSGRLTLNWQPTENDFVQFSGIWAGDQLLAQGVREQSTLVNFGYRRKINQDWSFQATVRDVFDEFGSVTTLQTPTFTDRTSQIFGGRAAYIGLTWSFGSGQRRPEQFDFTAPTTGS